MRVEMAAMKRDAEHYSRQVRNLFLFDQEIEYIFWSNMLHCLEYYCG